MLPLCLVTMLRMSDALLLRVSLLASTCPPDGSHPHNDSSQDTERFDHAVTGQFKCRCRQWMCQTHRPTIEHDDTRRQKRKVPRWEFRLQAVWCLGPPKGG